MPIDVGCAVQNSTIKFYLSMIGLHVMIDPSTVYTLSFAIGLSSSYFDGPFERYTKQFEIWHGSYHAIASRRSKAVDLAKIRRSYYKSMEKFRVALPWLRAFFFLVGSTSLALAFYSDKTSTFHQCASKAIIISLLLTIASFDILLFIKDRSMAKRKTEFVKSLRSTSLNKPAS